MIAQGHVDVVAFVTNDSFKADVSESSFEDDNYDKVSSNPVKDKVFESNHLTKSNSYQIKLCSLEVGQHFGGEYFFDFHQNYIKN